MRAALERGEDVNALDGIEGSDLTSLMSAAGQSSEHPFHEKQISVVKLLLEQPSIEVNLAGIEKQLISTWQQTIFNILF